MKIYQVEVDKEKRIICLNGKFDNRKNGMSATSAMHCFLASTGNNHKDSRKTKTSMILYVNHHCSITFQVIFALHGDLGQVLQKLLRISKAAGLNFVSSRVGTNSNFLVPACHQLSRNAESRCYAVLNTDFHKDGYNIKHSENLLQIPKHLKLFRKRTFLHFQRTYVHSTGKLLVCLIVLKHPSSLHRNYLLKHIRKLCVLADKLPRTSYHANVSTKTMSTVVKHYEDKNRSNLFIFPKYADEVQNRVLEYFAVNNQRELKNLTDTKYDSMLLNDFGRYSEFFVLPIIRCNDLEYSFKQMLDGTHYLSSEIMRFEHHRLRTFAMYEGTNSPSTLLMAKAGWYATGNNNETQTFCCMVINGVWSRDDDPLVIHRNFQPDCPFLQGKNVGQVAIQREEIRENLGSTGHLGATDNPHIRSSVLHGTEEIYKTSEDSHSLSKVSAVETSFSELLINPQDRNVHSPTPCVKESYEENMNSELDVKDHQLVQRTRHMTINACQRSSCSWSIDCPSRASTSTMSPSNNSEKLEENFQRGNENQNVIRNYGSDNTSTRHEGVENLGENKNAFLYSELGDRNSAQDKPRFDVNNQQSFLPPLVLEKPKHIEYTTVGVRVSSFSGFPVGTGKTPKEFAVGGFYYRGFGDRTACFQCGINLQGWSSEDDVFVEHARHNPLCQYVRQLKGDDFVRLVLISTQTSEVIQHKENIAKNLRDMGFEENLISSAIARASANNGQLTLQRALDNILHSANSQSNSLKELSHSYESSESSENTLASSVLDNESVASGSDSKLSSLFNSTDDQYLCKICMDERVNVVFIPCGHIATCLDCAKPLQKCPMCRAIVRGKISTEV
uniref:Baculoviral IAP repeat-containing protein 3-like n=1 Tax=Crassostrea virginica TaxID=6565 RepID=A0A8B8AL97_CRAVI|nr:baculoviral IAP repeat-containing protein 3-like [Crassostrea virginica]XP_022291916.1 baculoviral IAP repeat-containing protein 3-like [Crassostrea virginica]